MTPSVPALQRQALARALVPLLVSFTGCASLIGADFDRPSNGAGADASSSNGDGDGDGDGDAGADFVPTPPDDSGHCEAGRKLCDGSCVAIEDPSFGCSDSACDACVVPHGVAICSGGLCAVGSCDADHADCDGKATTGCETDVTGSHDHCGGCGTPCQPAQVCSNRTCGVSCSSGLTDCDGSCVDIASDPQNCGACNKTCPAPSNGAATCANQQCVNNCADGYHLCGAACVSSLSASSCGTSCTPCAAPETDCDNGQCIDPSSKTIFVSSKTYKGNLGGLAGADATCQSLASAAGLKGTYRAWLSDCTKSAASRMTHAAVPYQLSNGTVVASNWLDLIGANLASGITHDEKGQAVKNDEDVWSATAPNGASLCSNPASQTCTNWTSSASTQSGVVGLTGENSGEWSQGGYNVGGTGDDPCNTLLRIFCVQQ